MEWDAIIRMNIRTIIKDKGFIQKAVANRAGFSKQAFNDMLSGRRHIRADEIPRIANALGCDNSDIYSVPSGEVV